MELYQLSMVEKDILVGFLESERELTAGIFTTSDVPHTGLETFEEDKNEHQAAVMVCALVRWLKVEFRITQSCGPTDFQPLWNAGEVFWCLRSQMC